MVPEIVSLNGRTIQEQCVTSAGWICVNAQKNTRFVDVSRIDQELDVVDHVSKGRGKFAQSLGGLEWTRGMMIALQRTNPNSPFSLETGNRWPLAYPGGMKGAARWRFFITAAERMKSARHSSTHFLQSGWKAPIKAAFTNPAFQHSKKYRNANSALSEASNPLNTLDTGRLGDFQLKIMGSDVSVTAENDIGERTGGGQGNRVLDDKHRNALIEYGSQPLKDAVYKEESVMNSEIDRRLKELCTAVNLRL